LIKIWLARGMRDVLNSIACLLGNKLKNGITRKKGSEGGKSCGWERVQYPLKDQFVRPEKQPFPVKIGWDEEKGGDLIKRENQHQGGRLIKKKANRVVAGKDLMNKTQAQKDQTKSGIVEQGGGDG